MKQQISSESEHDTEQLGGLCIGVYWKENASGLNIQNWFYNGGRMGPRVQPVECQGCINIKCKTVSVFRCEASQLVGMSVRPSVRPSVTVMKSNNI